MPADEKVSVYVFLTGNAIADILNVRLFFQSGVSLVCDLRYILETLVIKFGAKNGINLPRRYHEALSILQNCL